MTRSRFASTLLPLLLCLADCSGSTDAAPGPVDCKQSDPDGADADCVTQGMPRKLDCKSSDTRAAGIAAGCVPEHADDPTDYDVCCPTTVSGKAPTAALVEFCAKCSLCVLDSTFQEGFCAPFQSGTSFDDAACAVNGSVAELAQPTVERATLQGWSCAEFDANE